MSQVQASCSNCGAPITFMWSSAVQTTCPYCKSILVRRDVNLQKVGVVADLARDPSPVQIGTEGLYRDSRFIVVGRIMYEYDQGGWNEWHIVFTDGKSAWLSDAQLDYAISYHVQPPHALPPPDQLARGTTFVWYNTNFQVTTITRANYRGVQGELPFEYWDKTRVVFADLKSADARFGTIDYSEPQPLLFLGEVVSFDELKLTNLKEFEGWTR
jgi:hypothetical protein